jgi:amino acid transporter
MFLLYFIPYALMVGELGATFKDSEGGVSSWINETMGVKWAYYAGWTYWACHVVYISSKSTGGLRAMSWGIAGNVR